MDELIKLEEKKGKLKQRVISSVDELILFRCEVNAGSDHRKTKILLAFDVPELNNWTPIGTEENPFRGVFDAQDYVIKNLNVNQSMFAGFFGYCEEAIIKNLTIEYGRIVGNIVGGVCGSISGGSIMDCYNKALVEGRGANATVGGICGIAQGSLVSNCTNRFIVSNLDAQGDLSTGGIVGTVTKGEIYKATNYGYVNVARGCCGGIAGKVSGRVITSVNIQCVNNKCDNTDGRTAGIVGLLESGMVEDCINYGKIRGKDGLYAGICAENREGQVNHCNNVGEITAESGKCGAIIGLNDNEAEGCYYYNENQVKGVCAGNPKGVSLFPTPLVVDLTAVKGKEYIVDSDCILDGKGTLLEMAIVVNTGRHVTLKDVHIHVTETHEGVLCKGNAFITLDGTNEILGESPRIGITQKEGILLIRATEDGTYDGRSIGVEKGAHIVINGGDITAKSYAQAAGIGGADMGHVIGTITINNGTISATGGAFSAGIGSGNYGGHCESVTINGGEIHAYGAGGAAGIGSGQAGSCYCEDIVITGGDISSKGGDKGAGIGTGFSSSCNRIVILGGDILAIPGSPSEKRIGEGLSGAIKWISISPDAHIKSCGDH